jgi:hypothetical protein
LYSGGPGFNTSDGGFCEFPQLGLSPLLCELRPVRDHILSHSAVLPFCLTERVSIAVLLQLPVPEVLGHTDGPVIATTGREI